MKKIISMLAFQFLVLICYPQVTVTNLLTENRPDPIGIDAVKPRFSWQLISGTRNELQTAYGIKVEEAKEIVWSSGKVNSDQSVQIDYAGNALQPGKKYSWRVRVWDNNGKTASWSKAGFFQMGLLDTTDWKAKWIMPGYQEDSLRASPLFRKQFNAAKKIVSATAYISSHGLYEARINGTRVGDGYLTPG